MKPRKLLPYLQLCTELAVRAAERLDEPQRSDALADIAVLSQRLTARQPKSVRITKKQAKSEFVLLETTYPALGNSLPAGESPTNEPAAV